MNDYSADLELAVALLDAGDVNAGVWHYTRTASRVWHQTDSDEWSAFVVSAVSAGLIDRFHDDPLTARSYQKPRGYAGDAELLDLIYDHQGANEAASNAAGAVGKAVNSITWNGLESRAVRWRREYAARMIDRLDPVSSRVLSIAAGSCRELSVSKVAARGQLQRFVALDQDEQSLAEAKRAYAGAVEAVCADAGSLLRGKYDVGEFDLIYSLGLFDYLSSRAARNLLQAAAAMAAPDAEIYVANFTPTPFNIGFMESAMAWNLIYRDESELLELVETANLGRAYRTRTLRDPEGTIAYLHIKLDHAA